MYFANKNVFSPKTKMSAFEFFGQLRVLASKANKKQLEKLAGKLDINYKFIMTRNHWK